MLCKSNLNPILDTFSYSDKGECQNHKTIRNMAKKQAKMVVLGARDANGNKVDLKELNNLGEKKIIQLHYHPKSVVANFNDILKDYKENKNIPKELVFLFEDACTMLQWAEKRMNVLPPPIDEQDGEEDK